MDTEAYQEEQDRIFLETFGSWSNPILHLSSSEIAKVEVWHRWFDAISKARHIAKKDFLIVDEFLRQSISGISRSPAGILIWKDYSSTGAVQRDRHSVPFIQIMHNKTFELLWLNMTTFKGFIGWQYYENGLKKEW